MSATTIGIIVAVVVVVAILLYVFKDKIFGKKGGQPPMVPPTPPAPPMPPAGM